VDYETDFFADTFLTELSDVTRPLPLYRFGFGRQGKFGKYKFLTALNKRIYGNGMTSEMPIFREV